MADKLLEALRSAGYNIVTNPDGSQSAAPLPTATQQNPAMTENVLAAITGSAQAVTPDIVVAGDSSQYTPRFDNTTGPDLSFEEQNANAPIYGGGSLQGAARAAAQNRELGFRREQLGAKLAQEDLTNKLALSALALKQRDSDVRTAKMIADIAVQRRKQDDDLKTQHDTAGLIKFLSTVPHDDPEYDAKLGAGLANFSRYDTARIQPILDSQKAARTAHMEGVRLGGAAQYSPESQAIFHDVVNQGGSPFDAHAAAKAREKDIGEYTKAVAAGFITPEDEPKIRDANGLINYQKAAQVAAQNAGTSVGKPVTQAEKDIQSSYRFIENFSKNPELSQDPNAKALNAIHLQRILAHEKSKSPGLIAPPKQGADYLNGL